MQGVSSKPYSGLTGGNVVVRGAFALALIECNAKKKGFCVVSVNKVYLMPGYDLDRDRPTEL